MSFNSIYEVFKFLVSPEVTIEMARKSVWYLSARKSVLAAVGDQGVAKMMKIYTDAEVVGVRPHHPKFLDALTILEDTATAFLSNQIKLDESLRQAKGRLAHHKRKQKRPLKYNLQRAWKV